MNLHEYQAKDLFRKYGIPVPEGYAANDMAQTERIIDGHFPDGKAVLKAQIHSGGRGKAGGVLISEGKEDALEKASSLFGRILVTRQTGPSGKKVNRIYLEKPSRIERELYLSLLIDSDRARHVFVACGEGGTSIEELAESDPERIARIYVDPSTGFQSVDTAYAAEKLGLCGRDAEELGDIMAKMYDMFTGEDCSLIEINPLAVTGHGLIALDAKVILDSDALFRHPENRELMDPLEEDPLELEAEACGMNFVSLDGDIGCICNGAGLGMSTMDAIFHSGSRPANFMDTGGTITVEKAYKAFSIVAGARGVRGIIINIFGGIARSDLIAEGVVKAMDDLSYPHPVVVRIEGNRADEARRILEGSKIPVIMAENCSDAVGKMMKELAKEDRA